MVSNSSRNSTKGSSWRATRSSSATALWASPSCRATVPSAEIPGITPSSAAASPPSRRLRSLSLASRFSQALDTALVWQRLWNWRITVVLPNPAGAQITTTLAPPAAKISSLIDDRSTSNRNLPGGLRREATWPCRLAAWDERSASAPRASSFMWETVDAESGEVPGRSSAQALQAILCRKTCR